MIIQKNEILIIIFGISFFSETIAYTDFKFCLVILKTHLDETVSQTFYLCLGLVLMTRIAKYFHGLPKTFGDPRLFSLYLAICDHRVHS